MSNNVTMMYRLHRASRYQPLPSSLPCLYHVITEYNIRVRAQPAKMFYSLLEWAHTNRQKIHIANAKNQNCHMGHMCRQVNSS